MALETYKTDGFYDELFASDGMAHLSAHPLVEQLDTLSRAELKRRQKLAEDILYQSGNTFNVYGDKKGTEKILPFDIIPRMVSGADWAKLERGIAQRITALNLFIQDIYNDQKILKDKVIPSELIFSSACYLKPCEGLKPPKGVWTHISGTDFVRDGDGTN